VRSATATPEARPSRFEIRENGRTVWLGPTEHSARQAQEAAIAKYGAHAVTFHDHLIDNQTT
jgi:hypothetical protein